MDKFRFDEETHQYYQLDERRSKYFEIPSVSQICSPILIYDNIPVVVLKEAKQRGKNIHMTIKMLHENTLDESNLAEGNKICLDAYNEWWDKERRDIEGLIVDIKTRKPYIPYDSVQLAGYNILLKELNAITTPIQLANDVIIETPYGHSKLKYGGTPDYVQYNAYYMDKYVLYLKPEGGYEFVNAERRQAESIFRTLLKKWWNDYKDNLIIENWRKIK